MADYLLSFLFILGLLSIFLSFLLAWFFLGRDDYTYSNSRALRRIDVKITKLTVATTADKTDSQGFRGPSRRYRAPTKEEYTMPAHRLTTLYILLLPLRLRNLIVRARRLMNATIDENTETVAKYTATIWTYCSGLALRGLGVQWKTELFKIKLWLPRTRTRPAKVNPPKSPTMVMTCW